MIEVKDLTKFYGDKLAVDHLSFSVEDGEIVGFLGPNGAGKSTTMNIVTGYLPASSGEVAVDGVSMFDNPKAAKRCIGYLPEIPPLYPDMTVEEYLRFMFKLKKVPAQTDRKKHIEEICGQVGIDKVQKRLIKNLSKGYRQRVGIAQAMLGNPQILILDEPTVGLDPNQISEIRRLILKLGKKHTVILSSHILQEIQAVCNRIIIINEGTIVADGTQDNLTRQVTGDKQGSRRGKPCGPGSYELMIEGPREQVESALRNIPAVRHVYFERKVEPSVNVYSLETDGILPIRRAVFDCVAGRGWRLLGLYSRELSLEEIFVRLTTGKYSKDVRKSGMEAEK